MKKAWITGLTLAGVAGSAGAAFAGISSDSQTSTPVEAQGLPELTTTTEAAARTATYQVGAAGTVTLTAANGVLTVDSAMPGAFFTLLGYSTPAAHVEVQFGDAAQQVTFIADLVNGEIVVSVSNVAAPGTTTTSSVEITPITSGTVAAPQPATPAATPIAVAVPAPSSSHTTSPSSAGGDDEEEHESDDSHEEQHEDEDEDEGDDD